MALHTGRILMRIGNDENYDIDKMMPGEWAVSTDKRIVRICVAPGIGIRMATYESFQQDMAKIAEILNECQTIQEAVEKINAEVSEKANAVAEYTNEAKKYRDEAKKYRDESYNTTPEGYYELVKNVEENTVKIDSIIEKAELTIKNTASGESIHLTDSSDNKNVEFALYGKANQYIGPKKNLLNNTETEQNYDGMTFSINEDKSVTVKGTTPTGYSMQFKIPFFANFSGMVKLTGSDSDNCCLVPWDGTEGHLAYKDATKTEVQELKQGATNPEISFYVERGNTYYIFFQINTTFIRTLTVYPMIRHADVIDDTYEPYILFPNPDNPQEIEISGANGSVVVKSCGKNLLKNTNTSQNISNVSFTLNSNGSIKVNGTNTEYVTYNLDASMTDLLGLEAGKEYIFSKSSSGNVRIQLYEYINGSWVNSKYTKDKEMKFSISAEAVGFRYMLTLLPNTTVANEIVYPMIRLASDTDDTYEPYKETVATIQTPNGLAGIPVGSGGNYTDKSGQQRICDEFVKYADGTGERMQRVKKFIFNGTESWVKSSLVENVFYNTSKFTDGMIISSIPVICNSYIGTTNSIDFMKDKTVRYAMSAGTTPAPIFYIKDSSFNTVDELKSALASKNIYGYYPLKEPIRTPLTAEEIAEIEKLQTFYPVTNITNDSDCGMKVTYLADSKNYIDNQLAIQAQAQETSMINMLLLLPDETQAAMIENDTNNLLTESEE